RLLPPHGELSLMIFATPGADGEEGGNSPATLGMTAPAIKFERFQHLFTAGARLAVPRTQALPPCVIDPRAKQRSRMNWWIANNEAREIDRGADALLCDGEGFITETSSANVLVVRDGAVWTPRIGTVLDGISLEVVRELCGS